MNARVLNIYTPLLFCVSTLKPSAHITKAILYNVPIEILQGSYDILHHRSDQRDSEFKSLF